MKGEYVIYDYFRKLTYRDQQQIFYGKGNGKVHLKVLEDVFWKGFIEISYACVSVSEQT